MVQPWQRFGLIRLLFERERGGRVLVARVRRRSLVLSLVVVTPLLLSLRLTLADEIIRPSRVSHVENLPLVPSIHQDFS